MGQLIEGVWHEGWYDPDAKGEFIRPKTRFQVPEGTAVPAEPGRYHLYVSYACPWAHRAIITRAFRGLEGAVGMTVVDPKMGPAGWAFDEERPDPLFGAKLLSDVYLKANARYSGRVTVPVLWDKQAETGRCQDSCRPKITMRAPRRIGADAA